MTETGGSMSKYEFTHEQVVDALHKVVEEFGPNTVYKMGPDEALCLYAREGDHGCIVGEALAVLGVPRDELLALTRIRCAGSREKISVGARSALVELGVLVPPETENLLINVQSRQDRGAPWGRAVEMAEKAEELRSAD